MRSFVERPDYRWVYYRVALGDDLGRPPSLRMPRFLDPVVLGTDRPLSFKQTATGTVLIGGGRRARVDRDAEAFLDGKLLFRSLAHFRDIEDAARGDQYEGTAGFDPKAV